MRVGVLYHFVYEAAVLLGADDALTHTLLIHLVVRKFLSDVVLHECSHEDGYERCRYADDEDMLQLDARASKEVGADDGCRGCRNRTARNAERGGYGGYAQRTFGTNLRVGGYLGDDGKERVTGVCRASHKAEQPCGKRTEVSDVCGMFA